MFRSLIGQKVSQNEFRIASDEPMGEAEGFAKTTVLTKSADEPVLDAHFASGWVGKRAWPCLASHDRGADFRT